MLSVIPSFFTINCTMLIKNIPLPSPQTIREELPLSTKGATFLAYARQQSSLILERKLPLFAVFIGPCSIHDPKSAIEYALRLQKLSLELSGSLFLVMRFFLEKPRTELGWKGMLYDPHLDGSYDMIEGIKRSRSLLLSMAELGVPCASELLDPLAFNYFEDLISWGFIGARTSASPIHRQLASGVSFPMGFKNSVHGDIDTAVAGAFSAKHPHCHIGINAQGQISSVETRGNPWTHIVLRGSTKGGNFDPSSVEIAKAALQHHKLNPLIL
ncbi:MAG: 3-deoxy-7-phosphoheptulonate synthase, partial [Chlamydiales bacterium]|nr:3-deoxy-7-phosphoheptulonate synthase [Chlamydiales bacterium]